MKDWRESTILVDTIFEEEEEEEEEEEDEEERDDAIMESSWPYHSSAGSTTSLSLTMLSLQSRVNERSRATGSTADAIVCVGDKNFFLHKEPLISRSGFLKRHLTGNVTAAVTLPAPVTAEAFTLVALFCYAGDLAFTPSNVASLRVAAEWLEMTEDDGGGNGDENLLERMERYFYRYVAQSPEDAAVVLRACVGLLRRDEETAAGLAGRCVEALVEAEDDGRGPWLDEMADLSPEVVRVVVHAMQPRFAESHDRLYVIVDNYIKRHRGDLTEEEKNRLCYTIDCRKLSGGRLVDLVRNPRMPLRFIMQAMLGDHLLRAHKHTSSHPFSAATASLGAILHRDATHRQASYLRAEMELTNRRIQCLESDVAELKRRLKEMREEMDEEVERAPTRSVSLRFFAAEEGRWGLGRRLVEGLRSVFRGHSTSSSRSTRSRGEQGRRTKIHRRSHSFA